MGSVEDSTRTGCPHLVCTEENMQQVGQAFIETNTQCAQWNENGTRFEHKF